MDANNHGGNSDSVSPQNHSAEDILSKRKAMEAKAQVRLNLEQVSFEIQNLTEFCNVYANEPERELTPFLNLYEISLEDGGQEEGGWHYDWLTPIVCEYIGCVNLDDGKLMEAYREEMRKSHGAKFQGDSDELSSNPDAKVPSHTSCSPRRATHVLRAESVPFGSVSHTRPHYE